MAVPAQFDFVVVGAGVAGLRAALDLAAQGSVLVVTKESVRESNTHYAQGGIAVALEGDEDVALHLEDTLVAGDGLVNRAAAEVLVRWRKPDGTLVLPGAFIPLAESSGLILALTRNLMRQVCTEMGVAIGSRPGLKISFNFAAQLFRDESIVKEVRNTFVGTPIDLSQVECLFQLAADAIVAQSATGATPARNGSRRTTSFWRGCLQSAGKDAWVAVDVTQPAILQSFLHDAGMTPPASAAADQLTAMLEAWTAKCSPAAAAEALQAAGIAAGPVLPAHTLLEDPHLKSAGFWRRIERRYVGDHVVPKPPFAIDGIAPALHKPSPTLGQHNEEVLRDVLGLSPAEIQALERDGIIGTRPT